MHKIWERLLKKEVKNTEDVLTNLTVVHISQYVPVSNHHIVHLKLTQCSTLLYLSKAGRKKNHEEETPTPDLLQVAFPLVF